MANDPSAAFRKRLRELRCALALTQEQLAERAGLNYKHYQEIERGGKTEVRFSTLVRLAQAFGIPLYKLFLDEAVNPRTAEPPAFYQPKKKASKPNPRPNPRSR